MPTCCVDAVHTSCCSCCWYCCSWSAVWPTRRDAGWSRLNISTKFSATSLAMCWSPVAVSPTSGLSPWVDYCTMHSHCVTGNYLTFSQGGGFPNLFMHAKPVQSVNQSTCISSCVQMLNISFNLSHINYSTFTLFRKRFWRMVWLR